MGGIFFGRSQARHRFAVNIVRPCSMENPQMAKHTGSPSNKRDQQDKNQQDSRDPMESMNTPEIPEHTSGTVDNRIDRTGKPVISREAIERALDNDDSGSSEA